MIVGCSTSTESVCTIFTSTDCSREKGLLESSGDDKEPPRERLTPITYVDNGRKVMKECSTFVKSMVSSPESGPLAW